MKRFGSFTIEDILIKKTCLAPKNTLKSDNYAENILKAYLKEKNLNEDFQELADEELKTILQSDVNQWMRSQVEIDSFVYKNCGIRDLYHDRIML